MDSKDSVVIMNKLKGILLVLTDDLLISISNKGTVNRGKKDLEKMHDSITLGLNEKEEVIGQLEDSVTVTIGDAITDSVCSCPAFGICRHIIVVLLYVKEHFENAESVDTTEQGCLKEDFTELTSLSAEELKKIVGKKEYISLIKSIRKKNEAVFSYQEMLQVVIKTQGIIVYFPKEASIENSICSCKERMMCRHKSYALLSFLMEECNISLPLDEENIQLGEKELLFLKQVKKQMETYLEKGMASLTSDIIRRTEQDYIRAYGMKLFRMAEEFKILSSNFSDYFSKNIGYSNIRTMHNVCKIYNRAAVLLSGTLEESKKELLIGKRKEESYELDEIKLIGLSASAKLTKRKDMLVSAYFYCVDLKEILILSTLRPVEENTKIEVLKKYLYQTGLFWTQEMPLNTLYCSKVLLKDAVITNGRISGTKSSSCSIMGDVKEEDFADIAYNDFASLKVELQKHIYQYFAPYSEAENVYLMKLFDMGSISYDQIKQKLVFPVYDASGVEIMIEIQYSQTSEKVIQFLEENPQFKFKYLLGSFYEKGEKVFGRYLGGMQDGKISNLFF